MQSVDLEQIDSSYTQDFDSVIDASEGRLSADLYAFQVKHEGKPVSVKIKVVGIGVDPKVWLVDNVVVVQANSGIWLLQPGSEDFKEIDFGYPLHEVSSSRYGLLVFHLLGCELVSPTTGQVIWRYMGGQLTEFSVFGDTVSLKFDDEEVRLHSDDGNIVS
ncbi:hypothetical protein [Rhizobium sp. MHM7A]|uniref:hypothetical protein n=1 Tax=Rhizobium sp. MHM7A TaxID=2583233 RepID=UPI001106220D|nr:hypothetical protein [Rhizobium sp. MHM7A]TLX17153.1 hypothetical protein FFR93_07540 [Rhizobium sp. MHM7A]